LVLDRSSLRSRYRLDCIAAGWQVDPAEFNEFLRATHDEFEECVQGRDVEIAPHLIGLVCTPLATFSRIRRAVSRANELRLAEGATQCTCGSPRRGFFDCMTEQLEKKAGQLERAFPGISELWRG
jgi:hypothetical protein